MDLLSLNEFTIEDIQSLIDNEVEENVHLDYKAAEALKKNDSGKNEITKDVSSFANSDGGIIIYGLKEINHKPSEITPVDGNDFTKERLDQIIANIQPHIKGVTIHPIRLEGDISKSIYVVKIPRSTFTPHMATDHRYYKRSNFQSVAMEDYEVRELYLRTDSPDLEIDYCFCCCTNEDNIHDEDDNYEYQFHIGVRNIGRKICKIFKIAIIFSVGNYGHDFILSSNTNNISSLSQSFIEAGKVRFAFGNKDVIFPDETIDYSPTFQIPYYKINKFLEESVFEIELWYEGGIKKYSYDLQNNCFELLEY